MDDVVVDIAERPDLVEPVLIEGLPGVGNVGKIGVDHLVDVLGAVPFATIRSVHLPAQVMVDGNGVATMVSLRLFHHRRAGGDIVFLCGDFQAVDHAGQYALAEAVLDICSDLGVRSVYTLGGYSVGHFVEGPRVFAAVNSPDLVGWVRGFDVVVGEGEPGGGIVGASGLLLGLGGLRGMRGVCLMGETHGYIADPASARAVLEVLKSMLGLEADLDDLDRKAVEVERLTTQIRDLADLLEKGDGDEVGYIR
ncbi:MAG: proteasome assembly chaperone family protein [Thermoplasmata archaeon]|nr:proteasome assembly chaperone family protein [Thermoplasmata archaeon]